MKKLNKFFIGLLSGVMLFSSLAPAVKASDSTHIRGATEERYIIDVAYSSEVSTIRMDGFAILSVNRINFRWFGVRVFIAKNTMRVASAGVAIAGIWVKPTTILKVARTLGIAIAFAPRGVWFDAQLAWSLRTPVRINTGVQ